MEGFRPGQYRTPNSPNVTQAPREISRSSVYVPSTIQDGLQHLSGFRATPIATFGTVPTPHNRGPANALQVESMRAIPFPNGVPPPTTANGDQSHDVNRRRPIPIYTTGGRGGWSTPHVNTNRVWMPQPNGSRQREEPLRTTQETGQRQTSSSSGTSSTFPREIPFKMIPNARPQVMETPLRGGRAAAEEERSAGDGDFDLSKMKTECVTPPLFDDDGGDMEIQSIFVSDRRAPTGNGNGLGNPEESRFLTTLVGTAARSGNQYTTVVPSGSGRSEVPQVVPYPPQQNGMMQYAPNNARGYQGSGSAADLGYYAFQNFNNQPCWDPRARKLPRPVELPSQRDQGNYMGSRSTPISWGPYQRPRPETSVELNRQLTYPFHQPQQSTYQQPLGGNYHQIRNSGQVPTTVNQLVAIGNANAIETRARCSNTATTNQEGLSASYAPYQGSNDQPRETYKRAKTEPPRFIGIHCSTCTCEVD